jgi:hypothetical protein
MAAASQDDNVKMGAEPDPVRLWYAQLAVTLYQGYREADQSPEDSAAWAVEDSDEIYRIFLGVVADIHDLQDKPDPACIQGKLPKGRRPTKKEKQEAIQACRKKK